VVFRVIENIAKKKEKKGKNVVSGSEANISDEGVVTLIIKCTVCV